MAITPLTDASNEAGADKALATAVKDAAGITHNAAVDAVNAYVGYGFEPPITVAKILAHLNGPTEISDEFGDKFAATVGDETPVSGTDPFDLGNISVSETSIEDLGIERPILAVPVEKPGRQEFFRVHPDPAFHLMARLIVLEADRESYLLTRTVWPCIPGETKLVKLTTFLTRTGAVGLWPLNMPDELLGKRDTDWGVTARKAAELGEKKWVRLQANMQRRMYDVVTSEKIPDPVWPKIAFKEILEIAFGDGRLITSVDHPVIRQLGGQ